MKDNERPPNPNAGPNMSLAARDDVLEQGVFQNSEMAYARNVEVLDHILRIRCLGCLLFLVSSPGLQVARAPGEQ